jgi:hypothetical protein
MITTTSPFPTLLFALLMLLSSPVLSAESLVYLFSFNYFKQSFHHQLGMTFFTNYTRSPVLGTEFIFSNTQAYPVPVYTNVYSLASLTYEPQFRLIEFGSSQSITLNTPLTLGFSMVDVCISLDDFDRRSYSPESSETAGQSFETRSDFLGWGHAELGALGVYNIGRNATAENTWPVGFHLGFGYLYTYGPIYIEYLEISRSDYAKYMRWGNLVGRLGMQTGPVGFSYTIGLDQTTVQYVESTGSVNDMQTSIYHKLTMTFNL